MLRVLLAGQDARLLAQWSRSLLADDRGWLPQTATTLPQVRQVLAQQPVDLIVTGLGVQDCALLDLLHQLRQAATRAGRPMPVLLVPPHGDLPLLIDALLAGADSVVVPTSADFPELPDHLAELRDGGTRITPWMAGHVLQHFGITGIERERRQVEDLSNPLALTGAEVRLLQALAGGRSLVALARELAQSPQSLCEGLRAVWRKMQWSRKAGSLSLA